MGTRMLAVIPRPVRRVAVAVIVFLAWGSPVSGRAQQAADRYGVYETDFASIEEYRDRRARLMSRMDSASVAVFRASAAAMRNGDVNYRYRQNSNLLYLTGCPEWGAVLLLVPDGVRVDSVSTVREILFVQTGGRTWTGEQLGVEGANAVLGFGRSGTSSLALPFDQFQDVFARAMAGKKVLYYTHTLPELVMDPVSGKKFVTAKEIKNEIKARYPGVELKSPLGILSEMRTIKSPAERRLLQKAIDATTAAHIEAMKSCEPAMREYELQAVIEYCFTRLGAEYTGFPSIVGSGPNALLFHYEADRRTMQAGETVVMDIGAEYHGYSADVTRTIPVNGTFSPAQRELYGIVLDAQQEAVREMKTGADASAPSRRAFEVLADGLLKLRIISDRNEVSKYCPHGISHPVGLEVHDVGSFSKPLQAGSVLTMEPGLYIPEGSPCDRKYWNIGIRIEDDVLVTDDGGKILSGDAPRAIADIERLMKKKGIGNQPIGTK